MIQSVRGTKDILPDTISNWNFVEDTMRFVSKNYGYQEIRTPIFEKTEVFSRGIGETTDVVNKEMYTFTDRGGESITLRPEMTAALVRSVIQNSLIEQSNTLRLWYFGPYFRYERPQKGRLRQFHQYGAECLGSPYPESDAETLLLANALFKNLGINDYKLLINTLGSSDTRKRYKQALVEYLSSIKSSLSNDSQNRLESNPLRVLDSKDGNDIGALANAPKIFDYLDKDSKIHFDKVLEILDSAKMKYEINPLLVRGLDYYSHTVFEFQSSLLGSQDSFGGGGRYNELFEQLGGKQTQAVGFALGIERILLILEQMNLVNNKNNECDIYMVCLNPDYINYTLKVAEQLRNKKLIVISDLLQRSMKAQMRESNKLNSKFTIIIGEDEIKNNEVLIKNMATGEQNKLKVDELENFSI